jgi:glycine dehydrogenase
MSVIRASRALRLAPRSIRPFSTTFVRPSPVASTTLRSSTTATQPHPQPPSASFHPEPTSVFTPLDTFLPRHLGPREKDVDEMLKVLGYESMDAFINDTIPSAVRVDELTAKDEGNGIRPYSELELRRRVEEVASLNKGMKSYIGMGYHNAIVPPVIQRNVSGRENHDLPAHRRSSRTRRGTPPTPRTPQNNPKAVSNPSSTSKPSSRR